MIAWAIVCTFVMKERSCLVGLVVGRVLILLVVTWPRDTRVFVFPAVREGRRDGRGGQGNGTALSEATRCRGRVIVGLYLWPRAVCIRPGECHSYILFGIFEIPDPDLTWPVLS
jgi:hypothetical protein